jgi:AcrR family transcriptional regulator
MPTSTSSPRSGAIGRPRDPRIDREVLRATTDLLTEVGYLQLTIGAIAERAGTTKPAIYRRWPTKAHLVHEAVFPADVTDVTPPGHDVRGDLRALVATGLEILRQPAARAALPGLLAEATGDPAQHAEMLDRFAHGTWGWLQDRIDRGIADGEVRPDVRSATVLELIAGSALVASIIHPGEQLDSHWVENVVDVIVRGIAP